MTGRKGRVVSTDEGIQYESRSETDAPLEILNLTEKQRFMDGEKVGFGLKSPNRGHRQRSLLLYFRQLKPVRPRKLSLGTK